MQAPHPAAISGWKCCESAVGSEVLFLVSGIGILIPRVVCQPGAVAWEVFLLVANWCSGCFMTRIKQAAAVIVMTALLVPRGYAEDIRDTKHNLVGLDEKEEDKRKVAAEEVCVFCHTPTMANLRYGGSSAVVRQSIPLWQSSSKPGHEYTLFDDIGRAAYEGVAVVGSVSVACLSCHDAAQAFNVGTNAPMSNDVEHPFGVPYRGLELSKETRQRLVSADEEDSGEATKPGRRVVAEGDFREVRKGVVNNRTVWWASAEKNASRRGKNDLPLYPRKVKDEDDKIVPYVECTSCHDPHTTNAVFLRVKSRGARLCLTCHTK